MLKKKKRKKKINNLSDSNSLYLAKKIELQFLAKKRCGEEDVTLQNVRGCHHLVKRIAGAFSKNKKMALKTLGFAPFSTKTLRQFFTPIKNFNKTNITLLLLFSLCKVMRRVAASLFQRVA